MSITRKGLLWGYGVQTTNVATAVAAAAGLRVRAEGGVSDLKSGMTHVDVEMQDGEWGRRDYTQYAGVVRPHWTGAPLLLSTGLIQKLVQQVCAEGTPDGSGNITYTLQATGVAPSTTKSLSIIRRNALATSKDKRLVGATIKSLKLSSSESQNAVHMDCDFLGVGAREFEGLHGRSHEAFVLARRERIAPDDAQRFRRRRGDARGLECVGDVAAAVRGALGANLLNQLLNETRRKQQRRARPVGTDDARVLRVVSPPPFAVLHFDVNVGHAALEIRDPALGAYPEPGRGRHGGCDVRGLHAVSPQESLSGDAHRDTSLRARNKYCRPAHPSGSIAFSIGVPGPSSVS